MTAETCCNPVPPKMEPQYEVCKILDNLRTDLACKMHAAEIIAKDIAVINKLIETIQTIEL